MVVLNGMNARLWIYSIFFFFWICFVLGKNAECWLTTGKMSSISSSSTKKQTKTSFFKQKPLEFLRTFADSQTLDNSLNKPTTRQVIRPYSRTRIYRNKRQRRRPKQGASLVVDQLSALSMTFFCYKYMYWGSTQTPKMKVPRLLISLLCGSTDLSYRKWYGEELLVALYFADNVYYLPEFCWK